jgi:phosphoglycolate phosphatase
MYAVGATWGFRTADELRRHGAKTLIDHPMEIVGIL